MSSRSSRSNRSSYAAVLFSLVLVCSSLFSTGSAAAETPSRIPRTVMEGQIKRIADPFVSRKNHLYWRDSTHPVKVTKHDQQTIHARLKLAYEVNNWFDPDVNIDFNLGISCSETKLILTMRDFKVDVENKWYSTVLSLGIVELFTHPDSANKALQALVQNLPLSSLSVPVCPIVSVDSDANIVLTPPADQSYQGPQTVFVSGKTDDRGSFTIPWQGARIDFAIAAVQHQNGNWHTLEASNTVDNRFWWNDRAVAGWIASPHFRKRPVRITIFTRLSANRDRISLITGQTDDNSRFSIPTGGAKTAFAMVAIQHQNGNWHTLEASNAVDNRFWWNDQAVAGWIASPNFRNRPFRAILFSSAWVITGQTNDKGRFSIPLPSPIGAGCSIPPNGGSKTWLHSAMVSIQHRNGNWHTLEASNTVDNRFWWNDQRVEGWIASPDFSNRPVRVILFTGTRPCMG